MTGAVLLSSAGCRVALLELFRTSMRSVGLDGRILATDRSAAASAFQLADARFLVPSCSDAGFIPALLEICEREHVTLVVPTIDPELPVLAAAREEFSSIGTTIAVSSLGHGRNRCRQACDECLAARPRLSDRAPSLCRRCPRRTGRVGLPGDHQTRPRECVHRCRAGAESRRVGAPCRRRRRRRRVRGPGCRVHGGRVRGFDSKRPMRGPAPSSRDARRRGEQGGHGRVPRL